MVKKCETKSSWKYFGNWNGKGNTCFVKLHKDLWTKVQCIMKINVTNNCSWNKEKFSNAALLFQVFAIIK